MNGRSFLLFWLVLLIFIPRKYKRKHRWWIPNIIKNRGTFGTYHHLVKELELSEEEFVCYFRLNKEQFGRVLFAVEEDLTRRHVTRDPISAKTRLAICLRFLATGETFVSLSYSYRVGQPTITRIVPEVCRILWERFAPFYMRMPTTEHDWLEIASGFCEKWQYPHCLGAIDGKHIVIRSPDNSGSVYYNYKGSFSIVLLALADTHLQFVMIDVGAYGRNSDGGIFAHSNFGKALNTNALCLPSASHLQGAEQLGDAPFVFIGDEAFPLHEHIMWPYSGRGCTDEQRVFNYRLSRARRCVESAFGVLATRWRVFYTKIGVTPETTKDIVKATVVLHNLLQKETTVTQTASMLHDYSVRPAGSVEDLPRIGVHGSQQAADIRDTFRNYFNHFNVLPWQDNGVRRGYFGES